MTEAAVRYVLTFPEAADEQNRLCEGLEGMIDAARRRFALLAGALERRRLDEGADRHPGPVPAGDGRRRPARSTRPRSWTWPTSLLAEEPGRPLRFLMPSPTETQAYLGGTELSGPGPVRRRPRAELRHGPRPDRPARRATGGRARELVLAGLLHDVGMLRVDPALLNHAGPWDLARRKEIEGHAWTGPTVY